jgi:hypothetical protein
LGTRETSEKLLKTKEEVMEKRFWPVALVLVMALSCTAAWADDGFYVVSVGGGVGTKITSVPYTISNPGFYYLGANLTYLGTGNAIAITANNVTLDLMGFSLTGGGKGIGTNKGIFTEYNDNNYINVEIRNGSVSGFTVGIAGTCTNERVSRIRAFNNNWGIWVSGSNPLIEGCISSNNDFGILVGSGRISGCVTNNNTNMGIAINGTGAVIGCVANNNGVGFALNPPQPMPIMVDQNSANDNGTNYSIGDNDKISWGVNAGRPAP